MPMKEQKMFVFRISKGKNPGNPIGHCPFNFSEIKKKIKNLKEGELDLIDYDDNNHLEFIHSEFWDNSVLRQGWGVKNLDIAQEAHDWIEYYMLSAKIYWGKEVECKYAKGRYNILRRILNMRTNDILFIPKTSANLLDDENYFVVCAVNREYYFDLSEEIKDFGHCINVKNKKVFKYGSNTLWQDDFSSPYLWAVTEIKKHHNKYNKFKKFIETNYPY